MSILILSSSEDSHANEIIRILNEKNIQVALIDTSLLPSRLSVSVDYCSTGLTYSINSHDGSYEINLASISSIWFRRPKFPIPPAGMRTSDKLFIEREFHSLLSGLYSALDVSWVNDPIFDEKARHKPYQLKIAQQLGLRIPRTLITSNVGHAKDFIRGRSSGIVYKQLESSPDSWRETRRVGSEEVGLIHLVSHCPVIFQEYIDAPIEVRVVVVGSKVFAAELQLLECAYAEDARMNPNAVYRAHRLPSSIKEKFIMLVERLGLAYAAIDTRLTEDGQYIFLEVNPGGQFLYIERAAQLPISEALADLLSRTGSEVASKSSLKNPPIP